jgi:hypothetical protein
MGTFIRNLHLLHDIVHQFNSLTKSTPAFIPCFQTCADHWDCHEERIPQYGSNSKREDKFTSADPIASSISVVDFGIQYERLYIENLMKKLSSGKEK